jgi:hypothetical protein
MKVCKICDTEKDISEFSIRKLSNDGLHIWCKSCNKEYLKNYYLKNRERILTQNKNNYYKNPGPAKLRSKKQREDNKEFISEYSKEYYLDNKEELSEYKKNNYVKNKEYYKGKSKKQKEDNKEEYLEYLKKWRRENREITKKNIKDWFERNPEKRKQYWKKLREENPHIIAWRNSLRLALFRMGRKKDKSTIDILKYSSEDFKLHMESLFKEGMSWDNWGEWHIDHIYPLSKFNPETPIHIVNALDNLQPLWAKENLLKNNKIS